MDIKDVAAAHTLAEKLKVTKGCLNALKTGAQIDIKIGVYVMPTVREKVAPSLEAVLINLRDEQISQLRQLGVEVEP